MPTGVEVEEIRQLTRQAEAMERIADAAELIADRVRNIEEHVERIDVTLTGIERIAQARL